MKRFAFLAIAIMAAVPAQAECRRSSATFDLPAQRLDRSVEQLSRMTDCSVQMDQTMVADRVAPAVKGRYTPEEVLARLVRNTGYTAYATPRGLAFDGSLLAASMSQSRVLRTALNERVKAGKVSRTQAMKYRAILDGVERDLPRAVDRQGSITPAQRHHAVQRLNSVRAAVAPVEDATGWDAFKRQSG